MSHLVSLTLTDISKEIVDEYLGRFPAKILNSARDYLYEDRLVRKLAMPGRLIAQLRGYQDSYLPHFELSGGSPQGGCTCGRYQPCAHFTALLLTFRDHPEQFAFPPYALLRGLMDPWPLLFADNFLNQHVPDPMPWWMLPEHLAPAKQWQVPSLVSVTRNPSLLADLHPSWLGRSGAGDAVDSWRDTRAIRKAGAPFWVSMWAYNPYLPLDNLFTSLAPDLPESQNLILHTLWSHTAIPFPEERQALAVRRLLGLMAQIPGSPVYWLWEQFPQTDPLYLARARWLLEQNDTEGAVRLLEGHWPADRQDQHTVRQALIAWLPVPAQLPYRIADCLETGSVDQLNALQSVLSPAVWDDLAQNFNRRWPSSAGS